MTIDRSLWASSFHLDELPNWACPRCGKHKLKIEKKFTTTLMPDHVVKLKKDPNWEFDWDFARVSVIAKCGNAACGDYVSITGRTTVYESYYEDDEHVGTTIEEHVQVHAVYPAPPIFPIPEVIPETVTRAIERAFKLYWVDASACAGALRSAIERLLDHLKIPTETAGKKGGPVRLDLHGRIELLGKMQLGDKESLHALRTVGNLGAHGAKVENESVLDAMELLEDSLIEILKIREQKIKSLQTRLKNLAPKKPLKAKSLPKSQTPSAKPSKK